MNILSGLCNLIHVCTTYYQDILNIPSHIIKILSHIIKILLHIISTLQPNSCVYLIHMCSSARRYPSACNAVETLLVHKDVAAKFFPMYAARCKIDGVVAKGYVCVYVYIYIYVHIHICIYICVCLWIESVCVSKDVAAKFFLMYAAHCKLDGIAAKGHVRVYIYICTYTYTCIYVGVLCIYRFCVFVCVSILLYIFTPKG